jgi:hypothetical protein
VLIINGVKRRGRFVSGFSFFYTSMSATVQLLLAEHICLSHLRTGSRSRLVLPFSNPKYWIRPRFDEFATLPRGHRHSSMASESLNSSQEDVRGHQHRSDGNSSDGSSGTPYATQAAAGAAAARAFFPLGYREGFNQWVSHDFQTKLPHSLTQSFA